MFGTLKGRLLITAAVVIVAAAILAARGITYGLDLSGGMYLALEVQDSTGTMTADVKRQHTEQVIQILRTRLDEFGVGERTVQRAGDYRIIVEIPGLDDIDRARNLIEREGVLEWQLVLDINQLTPVLPRMDRVINASGIVTDAPAATADTANRTSEDIRSEIFGNTSRDSARDTTQAEQDIARADL